MNRYKVGVAKLMYGMRTALTNLDPSQWKTTSRNPPLDVLLSQSCGERHTKDDEPLNSATLHACRGCRKDSARLTGPIHFDARRGSLWRANWSPLHAGLLQKGQ